MQRFGFFGAAMMLAFLASPSTQPAEVQKLNHVIVIYQENWSFDSLYGRFPGANGLDNAAATTAQVNKDGVPLTVLPQPLNTSFSPAVPDPRFPADLPVAPFDTAKFVGPNQLTARARDRHLALRQEGCRRSHRVRHDVDPQVDPNPLASAAACGP